jgi:hypothetical protein
MFSSLTSSSPSQLYSVSLDPNQTYFLAWQLELIPSWTLLAVQRYGEVGGPATRDVELTETELDWCVPGLLSFDLRSPDSRLTRF